MAWLDDSTAAKTEPVNAWLIVGDKEPPAPRRTWRVFGRSRAGGTWTGPSQARPRDVPFLYMMAPHKAVRFVARVTGEPFRDRTAAIDAEREVASNQWLVPTRLSACEVQEARRPAWRRTHPARQAAHVLDAGHGGEDPCAHEATGRRRGI